MGQTTTRMCKMTESDVGIVIRSENISDLLSFDSGDNQNRTMLQSLLQTISRPDDLIASPYQIHNFILNRKEFCTDWAQMKQAKTEVFHRLCELNETAYDYAKKGLELKKLQRKLELLNPSEGEDKVIAQIDREMLVLDIQQEKFRLEMMRTSAHGRFLEAAEFFKTYSQYQHLENLPPEEIAKLEKAQWETKSMYYPELGQRYNLTPQGIQMFPHESSIPRHQIGGSRK